MPPELSHMLQKLQASPRIALALLSGHSVTDLRSRLVLDNAVYLGKHGGEMEGPGISRLDGPVLSHRSDLVDVRSCLDRYLRRLPGVFLLDRGESLTVDTRRADVPVKQRTQSLLAALVQRRPRLQVSGCGAGWEILAKSSWKKKLAIAQMRDHLRLSLSSTVYLAGAHSTPCTFEGLDGAHTFAVGPGQMPAARYRLFSRLEMMQLLLCILYLGNDVLLQ